MTKQNLQKIYELVKEIGLDFHLESFSNNYNLVKHFAVFYPNERKIEISVYYSKLFFWFNLNDRIKSFTIYWWEFWGIKGKLWRLTKKIYKEKLKIRKEKLQQYENEFVTEFIKYENKSKES